VAQLDICGQRLANQHLSRQTLNKPSEIVRLFGAVQAQDYSTAKWGVAQRTRNATDAMVEKELDEGVILRTHVLRPTWHFVVAADIRWMLALTAPRVNAVLVGGWTRVLKGETTIVQLKLLTTLGDDERRAIAAEVRRFGAFLGLPAELV
jgi:hypothetical protein